MAAACTGGHHDCQQAHRNRRKTEADHALDEPCERENRADEDENWV
jgi:hypothetical protein